MDPVRWLSRHRKSALVMAAGTAVVLVVSVVGSTNAVIWSGVGVGVLSGMVIAYESGQVKGEGK